MRFTLLKAFVGMTFLALACAGMMYRNAGWASALITLSLALFAVTALRTIGLRGAERAFAIAFAAVGCGYLLLATSTIFSGIRESLFTNYPLAYAARAIDVNNSGNMMPYPMSLRATAIPSGSVTFATVPSYTPLPSSVAPIIAEDSQQLATSDDAEMPSASTPDDGNTPTPSALAISGSFVASSGGTATTQLITAVPSYSPTALPIESLIIEATQPSRVYDPYNLAGRPLQNFFTIGHCVWSWLLALLAGCFASWMYLRKSAELIS